MVDVNAVVTTADPDIDAVRHLNQFGTPDTRMMKIEWTPDGVEQAKKFFL